MSSVLKSDCGNPYAFIDNDDDAGQPYFAKGDVLPWEKSARADQPLERDRSIDAGSTDLESFAQALRASPSGNPWANVKNDDDELPALSFDNPYRHVDNESRDQQPYHVSGDRMPWDVSAPVVRDHTDRAWARLVTSQTSPWARGRKRHTDAQIEQLARALHVKLWEQRRELFGETDDPIEVLNPGKVLELIGYTVRYHKGGLGRDEQDGVTVDVAGLIDPVFKAVEISMLPSPMERLFTLAHELGHVVLGSTGGVVHRDRPLNGTRKARDADEREADKFAAYFLMPSKLLRLAFRKRFLTDRFELGDATAFALRAAWAEDVRKELPTLRDLSCYLATTEHYNAGGFPSLAYTFKVSPVAMAIRLEELGLVVE